VKVEEIILLKLEFIIIIVELRVLTNVTVGGSILLLDGKFPCLRHFLSVVPVFVQRFILILQSCQQR
jgi:hypothetical protein